MPTFLPSEATLTSEVSVPTEPTETEEEKSPLLMYAVAGGAVLLLILLLTSGRKDEYRIVDGQVVRS